VAKKAPESLIPIDRLKQVVKGLLAVPKTEVDREMPARNGKPGRRGRKPKPRPELQN